MTDDHYNQPAEGTENWDKPLNENFADLGVEVANEVPTWSDLPATSEVSQSSDGQWPVYRVEADDVFVRVTDSAQEIVGGLGSADRPLPEQHVEELSAEKTVTGNAQAHALAGGDGGSLGMVSTQPVPTLFSEYVQPNMTLGYDPDIYHKDHFDDGLYRVTLTDENNTNTDLYTASNPLDWSTYTKVADAIFDSGSDNVRVNDHVTLSDGRFAIYTTTNDVNETEVWVGSDLTNMSLVGQVMSDNDGGVIRAPDGTIHHYTENGDDMANDLDSNSIKHYTTPEDDLTNATDQGIAIDLAAKYGHPGGDADLINIGGTYLMFLDRDTGARSYTTSLFSSQDLYNWSLEQLQVGGVLGGDLAVTKYGGQLVGLKEQSEQTPQEISSWRLRPHQQDALWAARNRGVYWEFDGGPADEFSANQSGSGNVPQFDATTGELVLSTGTTSGSKSNLVKWFMRGATPQSQFGNIMTWAANRTLTAVVDFKDVDGEASVVMGSRDDGALTGEHVGIAAQNGDIIGTVGDGSTETTTTLISGASTGVRKLRVEHKFGDKAEFYVGMQKRGEITTGLPTGGSQAARPFMAFVANSTTTDRSLGLFRARFGQHSDSRKD